LGLLARRDIDHEVEAMRLTVGSGQCYAAEKDRAPLPSLGDQRVLMLVLAPSTRRGMGSQPVHHRILLVRGIDVAELSLEQLIAGVAGEHTEGIVGELTPAARIIAGDADGRGIDQPAKGLFALPQRLLRSLALADVARAALNFADRARQGVVHR